MANDEIVSAIVEQRRIAIDYDPGHRIVEPHAYGAGSDGQELLRAFQVEGASESGEHVDWKLFRVDRINSLELLDEQFDGPRPGYRQNDRAMRRIYEQL